MTKIKKAFNVTVHKYEDYEKTDMDSPIIKSHVNIRDMQENSKETEFPKNVLCVIIPQTTNEEENGNDSLIQTDSIPETNSQCFAELPHVDLKHIENDDTSLIKCAQKCKAQTKANKHSSLQNDIGQHFSISVRVFPILNGTDSNNIFDVNSVSSKLIFQKYSRNREFQFDHVFSENTNNCELYCKTIAQFSSHFAKGKSGACFTFGQTCSGKTHTLFEIVDSPGICFQFVSDSFSLVDSLVISCYEIYYEKLRDLMSENTRKYISQMTRISESLKMCSTDEGELKILNLTHAKVTNIDEFIQVC
ncbi:kinesin-like protein KIP2 [Octopus sinensis]|uniref:Kinesin-like protein KIP2 n=1 Tax=Octopus sinensis TaxID=2607531 RepID=A0A6P7TUW1_9MOLL|nr:kinesin-like protein KIP2 [Octopus sinensis]